VDSLGMVLWLVSLYLWVKLVQKLEEGSHNTMPQFKGNHEV